RQDFTYIACKQGAEVEPAIGTYGRESKLLTALAYVLGAAEHRVFQSDLEIRLGERAVLDTSCRCVGAPDHGGCPASTADPTTAVHRGRPVPVNVFVGAQALGPPQITVPTRETQPARWIDAEPARIGIESAQIDIPAIFIRLAAVEPRAFELPDARVKASGRDAVRDVRCVLPVVAEGRDGVVLRRGTMHVCDWPERRLPRWAAVHFDREILCDRLLEHRRQLHEEIMRMLPVVQRL